MKKNGIVTAIQAVLIIACLMLMTACSKDIEAPELTPNQNATIAQGVELDGNTLFGIWEGKSVAGGATNSNTFQQTYRLEFQSVEDAEVLYSHWYADARTNDTDSTCNVAYSYQFNGNTADMKPLSKGLSTMKAVHTGGNQMELYAVQDNNVSHICTLTRTSDPLPVVTGVDRTLPKAGDKVTVSGRNLQFVDHVFLPTTTGELEVTNFTKSSKQIQFILPEGAYAAGSVRCQATGAHVSTFSPAYMFCYDCIYMHNFYEQGTKAPYKGTEFEYTITAGNTTPRDNANYLKSNKLPEGHSLLSAAAGVQHPDSLLSFFGDTPIAWAVGTNTDPGKGYLRFSSGDRFQYVLDHCNGILTEKTKCTDAAIQMDIYVYSDGKAEWKTGYFSYRLDKNYSSITHEMSANVAPWSMDAPMSFADGWYTFTIPLSTFKVTKNGGYDTLGGLANSLKKGNKQSIIKLVNYQLDDTHPVHALTTFQFNIADIRLVPYYTPANKKE